MQHIIHSEIGLIHVLFSILSLIAGTCILYMRKGNRIHKQIGYGYAVAMLGVNASAFGLYQLFGSFGPFHVAAIISLLTLLAGMIPVILRVNGWFNLHVAFMYYSVIGLYAAFASEVIVRIPGVAFGPAVGLATAVVMITAMVMFRVLLPRWQKTFSALIKPTNI